MYQATFMDEAVVAAWVVMAGGPAFYDGKHSDDAGADNNGGGNTDDDNNDGADMDDDNSHSHDVGAVVRADEVVLPEDAGEVADAEVAVQMRKYLAVNTGK